ncbi:MULTISPECIES: pitrilysin family protein [unclassified Sinorhizobium]|uniref:M16 family metallopeptidase n=1 Tax=unclassified Sinorhizobium TaxID=2613772 RepID=UPI0024C238F4|nr:MULTISPECIES: pitrilysin family protein [unclassified Sinorhizobium]MDK1376540.1 pitrilysin family protein [Sinorhizobium sp. 6-70]MDK1481509.1 pitrilysin family protein [Sinorhizobium sp. 6-117]
MTMFNRLPIGAAKPLLIVLVLLGLAAMPARAAVAIQEVKTSSGIKAWLVEDYSIPIVTIRFAFRGGTTQDPSGKEGLVNLMTGLFDEGAGELDSEAFQERLDDAGAEMRFDAGRDAVYGSMRVLADQKDDAFDLLRLAIEQPRFDQAPMDRIRAHIVSGIIAEAKDPESVAKIAWSKALYGDHPYSRQDEGTEQALATATTSDLKALHKRLFARGNLTIAVAGAIDASALKQDLDQIFGGLPAEPSLIPVAETAPKLAQEIRIPYDLPQIGLRLVYAGLSDKDPQFFAAYLMNHILGGGAFTSRLWNEVREKRGLAYHIGSALVNNDHASVLVIRTETRPDRAAEALSLVRAEVRRMAEEGVSEEELEAAKKYVIGGYAIDNLNSSRAIANTLVAIQMQDLGIDHIERRKQLIQAVTVEDVRSAAKRLLSADPAVMIVGPPLERTKG